MDPTVTIELGVLMQLQQVDSGLTSIVKARGELPKELAVLRKELADHKIHAQAIHEAIHHLEKDITTQRERIKTMEGLIKKYENQQLNVRNNREYSAITKEIDLQKLEIQLAEKRIKRSYEHIEEKKLALSQHQAFIEKQQQMLVDKEGTLQALVLESEEEEQKLHAQRLEIVPRISESLLRLYEQIKGSGRNQRAVVTVHRGACGNCFNGVPPQRQADIKEKKRIIRCEHCGSILADVVPAAEEGTS